MQVFGCAHQLVDSATFLFTVFCQYVVLVFGWPLRSQKTWELRARRFSSPDSWLTNVKTQASKKHDSWDDWILCLISIDSWCSFLGRSFCFAALGLLDPTSTSFTRHRWSSRRITWSCGSSAWTPCGSHRSVGRELCSQVNESKAQGGMLVIGKQVFRTVFFY